ncbi:sphingosine-1-phosphate phosphatase 1-like [Bradysia coprophila]|uniref:sphingosine-1-phosphate phosphatase 1-like n=1 Tax=Bradysia coprophila TaxID=38358 RepID=UPI00187DB269|nr:sphingosine-1-phosphate phosphatase 1-like [Bradysia coprophila]
MQLIDYLKSPELVIEFQTFFGVKYLKHSDDRTDHDCRLHKRNASDHSSTGSSETDEGFIEPKEFDKESVQPYEITNKFWYWLFVIATELGDEIFYATMIPFWLWNVDGYVGRRVVFVWAIVMYVGQGLKDIIRWPRPGPPVHRLQKKWGLEYGLPSTHAMVSFSMPFSVVIFMLDRYQFSFVTGLVISTVWCSLICLSRLYLGMHSVLDIIAGLILTICLMIPLVPMVDYLDHIILSSPLSPLFVLAISILLIVYYPSPGKWTPTRGDTTMTISVTAGIQIGAWLNYQLNLLAAPTTEPPYEIIWPTYRMLGLLLLRTTLGLCSVLATRAIAKSISYAFVCALLGKDKNELRNSENTLENRDKTIVELCYKYFTCGMIGFNTVYLLPNVFKLIGIGRPDFYTEI